MVVLDGAALGDVVLDDVVVVRDDDVDAGGACRLDPEVAAERGALVASDANEDGDVDDGGASVGTRPVLPLALEVVAAHGAHDGPWRGEAMVPELREDRAPVGAAVVVVEEVVAPAAEVGELGLPEELVPLLPRQEQVVEPAVELELVEALLGELPVDLPS